MDSTPAQSLVPNEMPKDQEPFSSNAANKSKDRLPARSSVQAASSKKPSSKDPSPARLSVKSNNAKTLKKPDHSPARASVKSLQTSAAATASNKEESTKAIPKIGGGRFNKTFARTVNKNQSKTSLATTTSQKGSSTVLTKKTTNTVLPAKTATAKSKIPAMTRNTPVNATTNATGKTKTGAALQQKNLNTAGKTAAEKSLELKKSLHVRIPPVSLPKANGNSIELESLSNDTKTSATALTTSTDTSSKSQSARSNLGPPTVLGITRRSISNASSRSTPCPRKKDEFETNLRKMCSTAGDQNRIETLERKLKATQTEFLKEIQNLKDTAPNKLLCEYKFITMIKNDESKLVVKDDELRQLPKKFPAASVNDFKEKLKNHMEQWFSSLKNDLKNSKDSNNSDLIKIKEKLEHLECLKSHDLLSYIDDLCSYKEGDTDLKVKKLKTELEEAQKNLKKSEKMLSDLTKEHEEQRQKWEKDSKLKQDTDVHKKEQEIKELHKKLKSQEKEIDLLRISSQTTQKDMENEKAKLIDELTSCRESLVITTKKLQVAEQQFAQEKKVIKRLESELQEKKKLAESLSEMPAKLSELQAKLKGKEKPCKECIEHLKQINELNSKIESLDAQQADMKQQKEKLEKELVDQVKLKDKLKEMESKVKDLQKQLESKEKALEVVPESCEHTKFRQVEAEKRREIEKLKTELSKAQFNMCQLEQQIERDQQLLDVRSELINSLQMNEKNHRIHMEELFAQVGEKNNTITELNAELQTKSEEFRNLITNLSAKQMELVNQEHIIKLLEESNERSQMLRVKQEEKIGRMEEELAHLKQTISIYQGNILAGNGNKQLLFAPVLPPTPTDYNQNFFYYASQRKRKRQVDINVKKYEA